MNKNDWEEEVKRDRLNEDREDYLYDCVIEDDYEEEYEEEEEES